MEGGWPDPVAAAFCPADRPPIFTALEQQFGLSTFRRKNAFQLLRNTQVLAAESRLDGWVARSSGAASGGPCASKEHAHDLAAPRGFAGVPQSFGAARRGPCAFEIHAELPHTRRLIDATGDLLAHPLQAVRTKEIG